MLDGSAEENRNHSFLNTEADIQWSGDSKGTIFRISQGSLEFCAFKEMIRLSPVDEVRENMEYTRSMLDFSRYTFLSEDLPEEFYDFVYLTLLRQDLEVIECVLAFIEDISPFFVGMSRILAKITFLEQIYNAFCAFNSKIITSFFANLVLSTQDGIEFFKSHAHAVISRILESRSLLDMDLSFHLIKAWCKHSESDPEKVWDVLFHLLSMDLEDLKWMHVLECMRNAPLPNQEILLAVTERCVHICTNQNQLIHSPVFDFIATVIREHSMIPASLICDLIPYVASGCISRSVSLARSSWTLASLILPLSPEIVDLFLADNVICHFNVVCNMSVESTYAVRREAATTILKLVLCADERQIETVVRDLDLEVFEELLESDVFDEWEVQIATTKLEEAKRSSAS